MRLNKVIKKCTPINRNGLDVGNKKTFSFDIMKDAEFPEMKTTHTKSAVLSTMDYKSKIVELDAALPKDESYSHSWGMTKYYKDKSNEIITEKHDTRLNVAPPSVYYSAEPQKMYKRWDKYAEQYIELYGNDIYHQYHSFPNYDYEYFDRLDEEYDAEQKQYNEDALNEYLEDDEYYDKYSNKYGVDRYNGVY